MKFLIEIVHVKYELKVGIEILGSGLKNWFLLQSVVP